MAEILSDDDSFLDLQIDAASGESLENASWWARFSAIVVAVIIIGAILVMAFLMNSRFWYSFGAGFTADRNMGSVLWIIVVLVLAFCGLMIWLLVSFANKTSTAVQQIDQDLLERGLNSLKLYFVLSGVASLLGLLVMLLSFIK